LFAPAFNRFAKLSLAGVEGFDTGRETAPEFTVFCTFLKARGVERPELEGEDVGCSVE
jgi:hypothetical protein